MFELTKDKMRLTITKKVYKISHDMDGNWITGANMEIQPLTNAT